MQNILNCNYKIPSTIYIIGSGPNGTDKLNLIDNNKFIVALNASVLYDKPFDLWMVECYTCMERDWWDTANQQQIVRLFSVSFINYSRSDLNLVRPAFYFDESKFVRRNTIAGLAIQLFVELGARKLVLCGIDMEGRHTFNANNVRNEGDLEGKVDNLQHLIDIYTQEGIKFSTLSKTKLNIPLRA